MSEDQQLVSMENLVKICVKSKDFTGFLKLVQVCRMLWDVQTARNLFTKYSPRFYNKTTNSDKTLKEIQ